MFYLFPYQIAKPAKSKQSLPVPPSLLFCVQAVALLRSSHCFAGTFGAVLGQEPCMGVSSLYGRARNDQRGGTIHPQCFSALKTVLALCAAFQRMEIIPEGWYIRREGANE